MQYGKTGFGGRPRDASLRTLTSGWLSSIRRTFFGQRFRIFAVSILIGCLAGAIELGLPIEDAFRAVRAETRDLRPADDIVVVAIDDKSLNILGSNVTTRTQDAKVVENLFSAGAMRVFFDRAHADPSTPDHDQVFEDTLKKHKGHVYLGTFPKVNDPDQYNTEIVPLPRFGKVAGLASMMGESAPFGLSAKFPSHEGENKDGIRSISATLANYNGPFICYRPDFAINIHSVPTVSYVDVLEGNIDDEWLAGKDFIVGETHHQGKDFHPLPLGGKIAGVYFHAIAAETLRRGVPWDAGWLPALILAAAILGAQIVRATPSRRLTAFGIFTIIAITFVGDRASIIVEVFPALFSLTIGTIWLTLRTKSTHDERSGLLRLSALQDAQKYKDHVVFALKIRNFGSASAALKPQQTKELLKKIVDRIGSTENAAQYAFGRDVLVWRRTRMDQDSLSDHALGLNALFRVGVPVSDLTIDVLTAIGIDRDYDRPMAERIDNAIQSAEEAAIAGKSFAIGNTDSDIKRKKGLHLLSDLEKAIEEDSVGVAFQPKVNLATGSLAGAEALLRWEHEEDGPVSAANLVQLAEEHNRIDGLTLYVLKEAVLACRQARMYFLDFKVAVNISVKSLSNSDFLEKIFALMGELRADPADIILEITETTPIESDDGFANIKKLKEFGFRISIDDFGTGLSTIDYLRRIPSDEVKIDRSFISNIERSADDRAIVRSSIEMVHSLGRTVVAEGVESQRINSLLANYGCDTGQGYFYSRAIPMPQLIEKYNKYDSAANS